MTQPARIHIGTSGWHYDHWKGPFYPEDLGTGEMLDFYAAHFRAAEINNSFYRLPAAKTLETWRESVPGGFCFAVKASRYLTHMKKLKEPRQPLETFLERIGALGDRLGPVLFQLPPRWRCNHKRLGNFLAEIPAGVRCAFEFRDPSWFNDEVYAVLRSAGAAFCIYDLAGTTSPREVTADFVYLRLHGPGKAYEGSYGRSALAGWAGALSAWSRQGKEVFCFFDNDQDGYAARNALELKAMLEKGD